MRILENSEIILARDFFGKSRKDILNLLDSTLRESALIVKNKKILGRSSLYKKIGKHSMGFLSEDFKSDKTCSNHVIYKAIDNAINNYNREEIKGSTLYFTRVNRDKNIIPSEKPDCAFCSQYVLDNGISKLVLFHDFGFTEYDAEEYNDISFGFREWDIKGK